MRNILTALLVGLFAGLWWSEREKNQSRATAANTAMPRKSRTLEEMSPTYNANPHMHKELHVISPEKIHTYIDGVTKELIHGDLTELEVKNVRDYMRKLILDATTYYRSRERIENPPPKDWLDDMINSRLGNGS